MQLPSLETIEAAANVVYTVMPATPQICWPELSRHLGAEVWVKHENHTPTGAFKLRGGLVYFDELKRRHPEIAGVVAATRGNHGQSIAFAAQRRGLKAVIVVPHGNSIEKNAAMRARGADLNEAGDDFQAAIEHAEQLSREQSLHMVPSFDERLVRGVASYSLELFRAVPDLDTLYVPIGLGSGICGAIAVRDALKLSTEIVGVVDAAAPAYAESFAARRPISHPVSPSIADGMACRVPHPEALEIILQGAARIVIVDQPTLRDAVRSMFQFTHNAAEGAGAAALAAAMLERDRNRGCRIAVVQTGGNIDSETFASVLTTKHTNDTK